MCGIIAIFNKFDKFVRSRCRQPISLGEEPSDTPMTLDPGIHARDTAVVHYAREFREPEILVVY